MADKAGKKGGTVPRLGEGGADEPDIASLTNNLKDKNPNIRKAAATQLGEKGAEAAEAAEALKELLGDADQGVQRAAAQALAKILKAEAGEAAPILVEMVKEEKDPTARGDLILLLGEIGSAGRDASLADLAALLGDADMGTQRSAAYAVSKIAPGEVAEALPILLEFLAASEPTMRLILGDAVASYGPAAAEAVPHLQDFLKDKDPIIRRTVAYSLVRIQGSEGTDAIRILVEALKDEDAQTRMVYAMILGSLGATVAEQAAPALLQALKDEDVAVRRMAAASLIMVDKDQAAEAIPIMTEALGDPEAGTRVAALKALGELGAASADAAPQMIKLLAEEDPGVRRTAAYALVQVLGAGATDALPVLIADLAEEDPITRDVAAVTLGTFGPAAAEAIPALNKLLKDEMPNSRRAAALALMHIEGAEAKAALAVLGDALKDMDAEARLRFAVALGEFGASAAEALPALNAALKDEDLQVRRAAALSITQIDPKQAAGAVKVFAEGLTDEAPEVREQMAGILGSLKAEAQEAVPAVTKLLKDEVVSVRLAGGVALLQIQGIKAEGAAEVVNQALGEGDPLTRIGHIWTLMGLGEAAAPTLPALTKLLKDEDVTLRRTAAFALVRLQGEEKSKDALALLIEGFRDPDPGTRATLIGLFDSLKPPVPNELLDALKKALQDEDENVKVTAEAVLKRLTMEPTKEPAKEPAKGDSKEPTKEPAKEPVKEPAKEPTKEAKNAPDKN